MRLASLPAALASSLDFLQGTFEKICFQRFIRHQPLQQADLLPQFTLSRVCRWSFAVIDRLQLITPLVQQPPMHAELLGERDDVFAALQPLDRHLPKCLGVTPYCSLLCHLQFLSLQSVPIPCVSF
jgi:hypothetical protein